jgi:hypothetical protein
VANLSAVPVWLDQGSTLGTIQPYSGDIHPCELDKHTNTPNSTSVMMDMTLEEQDLLLILEKQINHELSPDNKNILLALLRHHIQGFAKDDKDLGYCTVAEHQINIKEGTTPVFQRPYGSAWKARKIIQSLSDDMLEAGLIEFSDSPWGAPVVLIRKKRRYLEILCRLPGPKRSHGEKRISFT